MNLKFIDPTIYNINPRTKLAKVNDSIAIVIDRKSRVIMKDGEKILDIARIIRKKTKSQIMLLTSAPVCSKTKIYLSNNNVLISSL